MAKKKRMRSGASARDVMEVRSGTGSARDRAEVGSKKKKKKKK